MARLLIRILGQFDPHQTHRTQMRVRLELREEGTPCEREGPRARFPVLVMRIACFGPDDWASIVRIQAIRRPVSRPMLR